MCNTENNMPRVIGLEEVSRCELLPLKGPVLKIPFFLGLRAVDTLTGIEPDKVFNRIDRFYKNTE